MSKFKPLLACEANLDKLRYPVLASPKLDGIRCIIHPELGPVTRSLKPIANASLRERLAQLPPYLDGELICGEPTAPDVMQRTTSAVMGRKASCNEVVYYVFDHYEASRAFFTSRLDRAASIVHEGHIGCVLLGHDLIESAEELAMVEQAAVDANYEGIMLRNPEGPYKFGRSTVNEGILLKVKRFSDMEGVVTGLVERMHNGNELTRDNLGHAKRSTAKAGKVPAGTLGALELAIEGWPSSKVEVGTGFDDAERLYIWHHPEEFLGLACTFKYQASGSKDAPRFPVFKGWRSDV